MDWRLDRSSCYLRAVERRAQQATDRLISRSDSPVQGNQLCVPDDSRLEPSFVAERHQLPQHPEPAYNMSIPAKVATLQRRNAVRCPVNIAKSPYDGTIESWLEGLDVGP
jgi:hypothetical protein